MKYPLILLVCFFALYGCNSKTKCTDYQSYHFWFTAGSTTDSIPDTMVVVSNYSKGSNFNQPIKSDTARVGNGTWRGFYEVGVEPGNMNFGTKQLSIYDWKYVFYPSGKTYLMKDIQQHQRSEKQVRPQDHECYNDITLTVNDSLYKIPGSSIATAFIGIKY